MTNLIALESGTELVGDFRIERVLGAGGFGITYLAGEAALARQVTIKEYFPSDFAARANRIEASPRSEGCANDYRWGLDRFIEEAQTLAQFNHPNIVRVYRYFRANNTGYMVLHFEEGQSLKAWLKSLGRAPRQKELDSIVAPLLDALELIHNSDFLHRDIAPDNIIIRKDGSPVLIDFGSARREIAAHTKTVSALVKPGYSPYEQYAETSHQQGAWTDIYALGATLYHAIAGKRPADSPSRMVKDDLLSARDAALSAYRPQFLKAIDHALALSIEARPQSIKAWRRALLAPEPQKQGWLSRTRPANKTEPAHTDSPTAEPQSSETPAPAMAANGGTVALPPPPDVPGGAPGGMLEFFAGVKKKREKKNAPAPKPQHEAAEAPAPVKAQPVAKIDNLETPLPHDRLPRIFKVKSGDKKPAKRKAEAKQKRKPARPRPIRLGRAPAWRPLLFKLLVGVGVASGAVAMQDKFPRLENRGSTVTSATIKETNKAEAHLAPSAELRGHIGTVNAAQFTADGRYVVSTGEDGSLKVWNAGSANLVRTIELDDGPAAALALYQNKALTGHANGAIVLWDIERAEKLSTFKRNAAQIWSLTFVGRPDRFAASGHDWKVALWDTANASAPLHVIDAHKNAAQAVAFANAPRGPLLATGGADKRVNLWNLDTIDRIRSYRGHKDFVTALTFSPSGKTLASGSLEGGIRLWSPTSRRVRRRLRGHRQRVESLAFSPDGNTLASASADGQLRIWNPSRGRTRRTILGHSGAIKSVAFSPDGEHIASAGQDGVIRLWANPALPPVTN
jgi:WD40 repeat protein/serine/threonine protein kinase